MNEEPAAGIGVLISALLAMIWVILDTAGVAMTDNLKNAVQAFIYALIAVPAVTGLLIRFFVTPTAKAEEKIEEAYVAVPGVTAKPTI